MDWIRENKPLATILGVIIAATLGLGYLLFDAWSAYSQTRETYQGVGGQIAGLKSARLAPTEDNLKAKKALVDEYGALVNQLGGALVILQPPSQPVKDIEFQSRLKSKIADARKAAVLAKMSLPQDFAFGFDEYTSALPKSAEAATELSRFLDAVDELVRLFMKCGVLSVDLLERSKLPQEQAAAAVTNTVQGGAAAPAILEKRQISLILTLDQGSLQLLISRLANPSDISFFTSLRLLRIENEKQEGPLRAEVRLPEAAPAPGGDAAVPAAPGQAKPASDEIKPPAAAPVDSVPVLGEERLKVRMELDLVKFLEAAKGAAAR